MNPLDAVSPDEIFRPLPTGEVDGEGPCEHCAPIHRNIVVGATVLGVATGLAIAWYLFSRTTHP